MQELRILREARSLCHPDSEQYAWITRAIADLEVMLAEADTAEMAVAA